MDLSPNHSLQSMKIPLFMDISLISYHESIKTPLFMDLSPNHSLRSMKIPLFMDISLISYHESIKTPLFMDWVCDVCEKGLAKCQPFEILYASQRLLLVNALVVSAALRTCLATEWTLSTWLRTSLCCLRHIL